MKLYKREALTIALMLLAFNACGGEAATDPEDSGEETSSASTSQTGGSQGDAASSTTGPTCRQLGIGNYMATFSSCSDGQVWALLCKQAGQGYECECEVGPFGEGEVVETVTLESGKPYDLVLGDVQTLHGNATAAANEMCGFQITHPCDGTS